MLLGVAGLLSYALWAFGAMTGILSITTFAPLHRRRRDPGAAGVRGAGRSEDRQRRALDRAGHHPGDLRALCRHDRRFPSPKPDRLPVQRGRTPGSPGCTTAWGSTASRCCSFCLTTFLLPLCIVASWRSITVRGGRIHDRLSSPGKPGWSAYSAPWTCWCSTCSSRASSIPMFLIIGIWGGKNRVYAAYKFFLYTLAGIGADAGGDPLHDRRRSHLQRYRL